MRSGIQQIPPMNAVYFGANAAEALALEVEKRRSQRVFLLVSGTLNRETNEIRFEKYSRGATPRNTTRSHHICLVTRS